MNVFRASYAEINLKNLVENFIWLKEGLAPGAFFCPMIKANAYGHGAVDAAQALAQNGAEAVGVALIEEALVLREAGVTLPILVFGIFAPEEAGLYFKHDLVPVISEWHQLRSLVTEAKGRQLNIHLKFNTGMNRLGFSPQEAAQVADFLRQQKALVLKGVCTHLASAENLVDKNGSAVKQLQKFEVLSESYKDFSAVKFHALNSAGIIHFKNLSSPKDYRTPFMKTLGARPGLSLYGVPPFKVTNHKLNSVMAVKTHLVKIHQLQEGEGVSYGGRWVAPKSSLVGVLPFGYADGYHRRLSNQGEVLYRGERVPVVGTVCMDYIMVDLTSVFERQKLDVQKIIPRQEEIVLLGRDEKGNEIGAAELAEKVGTISYEMLTSMSWRVPRVLKA